MGALGSGAAGVGGGAEGMGGGGIPDDKDTEFIPAARLFIKAAVLLLFMVMPMLMRPVGSLLSEVDAEGAVVGGANGSFCTEKSNRLEEAGAPGCGIVVLLL